MFRLYTKTFGGKIWFDLHRVSPGNVFDKSLNKAVFKISHQKIFNTRAQNCPLVIQKFKFPSK